MTTSPLTPRVPLVDNPELSIYWDNHLRDAFLEAAPVIYPPFVEASIAHVYMLCETGILSRDRATRLISGLLTLWTRHAEGHQDYIFDGSVEDPYYFLEQQLAAACGIGTAELDVQLARSRNDLDAGAFRMVLRRQLLDQADLVVQAARDAAELAEAHTESLIIGFTHRRPAQPTTIGHVLSGFAEALLSQADEMLSVYDELNVSPLGSAAFTGTDLPIDSALVGRLLGFDRSFTASYEAVAGAEHFMRLAAVQARSAATGARLSRVLLEWMTFRWIATPTPFTQGSSIMPQKKNPVVLEHMVSMAGASAADMAAVFANIGAGWYEDSNNATTDVQKHLWRAGERGVRFMRMLDGLFIGLELAELPSIEFIVKSGATTTAVAEALAARGVPWRAAHDVVGTLVRAQDPTAWTAEDVERAFIGAGLEVNEELTALTLGAGQRPERILEREQVGSPGREAVRVAAGLALGRAEELAAGFAARRGHLDDTREALLSLATTISEGDQWPSTR